ncbi:hypothetical protein SNEBB_007075 [Seison nebaliae]|nr:hypothetical protein SNEBB_007075 [Seison nebaliae]
MVERRNQEFTGIGIVTLSKLFENVVAEVDAVKSCIVLCHDYKNLCNGLMIRASEEIANQYVCELVSRTSFKKENNNVLSMELIEYTNNFKNETAATTTMATNGTTNFR